MLRSLTMIGFIIFNIAYAETINVPMDQPTIQAGIDSVMSGDTVLVSPGYYSENINYNGKNIVVGSLFLTTQDSTYISQTIIDGNENGSVVTFEMGENLNSTLCGFTITNGSSLLGGGIHIVNSSPTIVSNYIIENTATFEGYDDGMGAGIYISNGSPAILKNKISGNVGLQKDFDSGNGAGIYLDNSSSEIRENVIIYNKLEGIFGRGGGIYSEGNPKIVDNIISNNIAGDFGGGIYFSSNSTIWLKQNIISSNSLNDGINTSGGIYCQSSQSLEISDNTFINNELAFTSGNVDGKLFSNTFKDFSNKNAISIGGTSTSVKTITIKSNLFENITGSAIDLSGTGNATINCDILNNIFRNCGGIRNHIIFTAIDIGGTGEVIINSIVSGNLIVDSDATAISIGGISSSQQNGLFVNNTITNNSIGISKWANINNFEIVNSIIIGNNNDLENVPVNDVRYSNIGDAGYKGHNGNITSNTMFINAAGGNYQLQNTSPCIDAGDPIYDYSEEPLYNGKRINMGAYGNTNLAAVSNPEIELSIQELTFDSIRVNWSDSLNFWIQNTGLTRLNIDPLFIETNDGFYLNSERKEFIFPGDSLLVNIVFNPLVAGVYETDITIISNDEDEGLLKIKVTGSTYYQYLPTIKSITDIPGDQGGWVKVQFYKSDYDTDSLIFPKATSNELYTLEIDDGFGWTAVATTLAYGKSVYSVLVPTTKDSTSESDGLINFRVIAGMNEGNFVSPIVAGYSVDNLKPSVPSGLISFLVSGSKVKLKWLPNSESDFQFYTIYRTNDSQLETIQHTTDTVFTDSNVQVGKIYSYAITATDHSGNESNISDFVDIMVTSLEEEARIPNKYYLSQNYPNPFNPTTTIEYGLKEAGKIKVVVYDVLGNKITELVNDEQNAGHYSVIWNGKNSKNEKVSSGVFFYQIITPGFKQNKRMVFFK